MALKFCMDDVQEVGANIWRAEAPPPELMRLGAPLTKKGPRSVILVDDAWEAAGDILIFETRLATLLNLGTSSEVLIIGCDAAATAFEPTHAAGSGDREFLSLVERQLTGEAKDAAQKVLAEVRKKHPGDLKRGQRNNFSETPDNFWYVIVQPRNQTLSITIRGLPDRFRSSALELKQDRPGYTRFTVRDLADAAEAVKLIEESVRK